MKFIYPDMYRVDVFENGRLLSQDKIEERIRQYLRDKIKKYNEYLSEQLQKAPAYYAQHPVEYDFLAEVDRAASPYRSYTLFSEDYLF